MRFVWIRQIGSHGMGWGHLRALREANFLYLAHRMQLRYRAGELQQLNIDHNFGVHLDQMVQEGSITTEEALRHPQRAALTSYLGIQELTLISGNRIPFPLQKDDVLLQCTDGLYRCLSDDAICQILNATKDLKQASKLLVETALTFPGAHDNTSVLLTKYKG